MEPRTYTLHSLSLITNIYLMQQTVLSQCQCIFISLSLSLSSYSSSSSPFLCLNIHHLSSHGFALELSPNVPSPPPSLFFSPFLIWVVVFFLIMFFTLFLSRFERYLYDYLVKRNMHHTAEVFRNETNLHLGPAASSTDGITFFNYFVFFLFCFLLFILSGSSFASSCGRISFSLHVNYLPLSGKKNCLFSCSCWVLVDDY